jgi:hypothetical protein
MAGPPSCPGPRVVVAQGFAPMLTVAVGVPAFRHGQAGVRPNCRASAWRTTDDVGSVPLLLPVHAMDSSCTRDGSPCGSPPAVTGCTVRYWLDSTLDLTCTDRTQDYAVDAEHQPTDLAVGGSSPLRRAASLQGCSSASNGRSARARTWATASTAWTTPATTSRQRGLDDPRRSKTGTGAAGSRATR